MGASDIMETGGQPRRFMGEFNDFSGRQGSPVHAPRYARSQWLNLPRRSLETIGNETGIDLRALQTFWKIAAGVIT